MDDKVITDSIRLRLLRKRNTMDVGHECSKRGANNSRMPRQGLDTRQIDCRVDWDGRRGKNDEVDLTQLGYISTFLKLRPPDSRPRLI